MLTFSERYDIIVYEYLCAAVTFITRLTCEVLRSMKLLNLLLKKPVFSQKVNIIFDIAATLVLAAAVGYAANGFGLGLPVTAVVCAAIIALMFVLKPNKLSASPVVLHFVCLTISGYLVASFLDYVKQNGINKVLFGASCFIWILFLTELIAYVIVLTGLDSRLLISPQQKEHRKAGCLLAFIPVFALMFTVFVYIPSETFFNNYKDFYFCFLDFAPLQLLKALIVSFFCAIVMYTLSQKAFRFVCCLLCGALLGAYCQCAFMNSDLPAAMGDKIDWSSLKSKMIINALIWLGLMILPFIVNAVCRRIKALGNIVRDNSVIIISGFIGGMQLLSLIIIMFTTQAGLTTSSKYMLSAKEQFVISKNKNIITIIIDMGDKHFFEKAREEYPEKFDCLSDFTYYDNACMMYDSTDLSIPQMLSGTTVLPEDTLDNWLEKTWTDKPCELFYSRLHDNNYKVNVFGSFEPSYELFKDKFDNVSIADPDDIKINRKLLLSDIDKISMFRCLPLCMKENYEPGIEVADRSVTIPNRCIIDNVPYYNNLELRTAEDDKNYFIVEHLNGTHRYSGTIEEETQDCLNLIDKYIMQLKELGVYDDSVIIITADHGEHFSADNMPIWYIKSANEHHDQMQVNHAPIHHSDYAATCLDEAGIMQSGDEELLGRPISQIGENEQRERLVFQRDAFKYVGHVNWKRYSDDSHDGALFGYYFTGTEKELVEHEKNDPPDVLIELDDY